MIHTLFKVRRQMRRLNLSQPWRMVVAVVGGTVLALGLVMVVLPGPAIVAIPLGLAILATEFLWARRWLRKARRMVGGSRRRMMQKSHAGAEVQSKA